MRIEPLDEANWPALEGLFGPNGADGGCWCMFFRLQRKEFTAGCGEPNRQAFRELAGHEQLGLLAVDGERAVGWVAVAPRAAYPRLERSVVAKPPGHEEDLGETWSVTCFFVHRTARRNGVTTRLLRAAVDYAAERGARTVEGYPVDTEGEKRDSASLFHGTLSAFLDAGFELVDRRGTRRALVRKALR